MPTDKCKENDLLRNLNSDIQLCAGGEAGKQLESISYNFFTPFESYIFSQHRKIMVILMQRSRLQKSVSKFMPKKIYEIDPKWLLATTSLFYMSWTTKGPVPYISFEVDS